MRLGDLNRWAKAPVVPPVALGISMGHYFLIVNLAKRQYIDADRFGDNVKRNGILNGFHGAALGLLLFDGKRHGQEHALLGGWAGDPVVAAADAS